MRKQGIAVDSGQVRDKFIYETIRQSWKFLVIDINSLLFIMPVDWEHVISLCSKNHNLFEVVKEERSCSRWYFFHLFRLDNSKSMNNVETISGRCNLINIFLKHGRTHWVVLTVFFIVKKIHIKKMTR